MCNQNVHTFKPDGIRSYLVLCCSYLVCGFGFLFIALHVLPYHFVFMPLLYESCVAGHASWSYYAYCRWVTLACESLICGNYLLSIMTSPGYVNHDIWKDPPIFEGKRASENPFTVTQLDRHGKLRYCSRCEHYQPDHAHHCNLCNRCVYRMDHHCPCINNCVGRNNAKYFLLFLAYIPMGAFQIAFSTAYSCFHHLKQIRFTIATAEKEPASLRPAVMLYASIILSFSTTIVLGIFAAHFFRMAHRGETSISAHVTRKRTSAAEAATRQASSAQALCTDEVASRGGEAEAKRRAYMYDVLGADRRWWRVMWCFAPVRDERGLPDEAVPEYDGSLQRLV